MECKVISDIHINKQHDFAIEDCFCTNDKNRLLLIAGDIGSLNHWSEIKSVLMAMAERSKHVVLILGNHECAYGDVFKAPQLMQQLVASTHLANITFLHRSSFIYDDIAVLGTTLWSDIDTHSEILFAENQKKFDALFEPLYPNIPAKERFEIMCDKYHRQKKWLFDTLAKYKNEQRKTLVITHHAPSMQSINPKFSNDDKQHFYASDLNAEIIKFKPEVWIHGHTHFHNDYLIGNTRIIGNPLGLPSEVTNFDPHFRFSL